MSSCRATNAKPGRGTHYAIRRLYRGFPRGRDLPMHREILGLEPNDPRRVDHVNGDGLDNRRTNLRTCTPSENTCNSVRPAKNSSGYRGVTWSTKAGKWQVNVTKNKRRYFLGYFDCKEEAAAARDRAALVLHGEFARTNKARVERTAPLSPEAVDAAAQASGPRADGHFCRKLSADAVREMRTAFASGETHTSLAKRFGVARGTVYGIVEGKKWRNAGLPSLARLDKEAGR